MSNRNRPLVIAVAAVAVVAVVGGGLLAAARGPQSQSGAAAAPLTQAVAAPPAKAPALTVKVDATKLATGRDPQVAYLRGRTVLGGVGNPVVVPGAQDIQAVTRLWDITFTLQVDAAAKGTLVVQDGEGKVVRQIKGVDSLAGSADGQAVVYGSGGVVESRKGGTVFYELPTGTTELAQPKAYGLQVLSVTGKTVFFSSAAEAGGTDTLYRWNVDQKTASAVPRLTTPQAVSADGTLASSLPIFTDSGLCSAVTDLATDLQRWKSCQNRLDDFSPGGAFVIGLPPNQGGPFGVEKVSALDAKTGKVLRNWTAPTVPHQLAEDDDHILLEWYEDVDARSRSAVVRCTVSTGQCELATPLSKEPLLLGS
ncbi:hypothetical protein E1263_24380 [Kribbella antibiotica]|uniref:WD40 repeat domain-containing protein n=1 Tax=Kribbella antibiotica TaxID=190195 RepID=A0A4R4ZI03_9ACTN|nr:hypothetical protein [Kribbella antibiotica]TDD57129.1 hypothetical protein E1263_24380 [Kribbella antibiotica]